MLPTNVTQYMPHVGLLLLLVGFVFGIVATSDAGSTDIKSRTDTAKWSVLSQTLLLSGGFLLITGSLH
jgi:hypothetical protein